VNLQTDLKPVKPENQVYRLKQIVFIYGFTKLYKMRHTLFTTRLAWHKTVFSKCYIAVKNISFSLSSFYTQIWRHWAYNIG